MRRRGSQQVLEEALGGYAVPAVLHEDVEQRAPLGHESTRTGTNDLFQRAKALLAQLSTRLVPWRPI
jgi:hypothetical protein